MKKDLTKISNFFGNSLLDDLFRNNENYELFILQKAWKEIVTPVIAKESFVVKRDGTTLLIQVTNSIFREHLYILKNEIIKNINELPYNIKITDLRFQIGSNYIKRKSKLTTDKINEKSKKTREIHSANLSEKEEAQLLRWIERHIKNEDLKKPFTEFMLEMFKNRKGELLASYTPCVLCHALCEKDSKICMLCENTLERKKKHAVVLILKKKPHLKYNEVNEIFPCTFENYSNARNMLITRYKDLIYKNFDKKGESRHLLSLLIHKPLETISEEDVKKSLKYIPRSKFNN